MFWIQHISAGDKAVDFRRIYRKRRWRNSHARYP